ncbi:MAG: SDR family oxidoreductase [Candidatus Vogelbacteria bacterium]|nr:SDR family oxidoreductase [Candidatus Vogelbacteria bacterium]
MNDLFDLHGEIAVVIGATGLLGGAIARGLGASGAVVAVLGRNVEHGEACAETILKRGGAAAFFEVDAADPASLRRAHERVAQELGAPTVLVNAAGGNDPSVNATKEHPFESIRYDDWERHFKMNVGAGALLPLQEFGPAMCARGKGSIINLASLSGHIPLPRMVAYSASKAVIINMSRYLAREWASRGVRVNTITPGFIPAEQNRRMLIDEGGTPGPRADAIFRHTPMGRFGEPEELIGAVVFLASHKASGFITGIDIPVDGGFLAQTI